MILVWRICTDCGRRFSFWHKPGAQDMRSICPDCLRCSPEEVAENERRARAGKNPQ